MPATRSDTLATMDKWGDDNLSKFLNMVHANQQANRVNFATWYAVLQTIDECFAKAGKHLINPKPVMVGILLLRAQFAFKAAAGMALSGQVVETFTMMRSVLEYAGYALVIFETPVLQEVFMFRHRSEGELKAQKKAFNVGAVRQAIARRDKQLAGIFDDLYQRTIDFGGHPNPHATFSAMKLDKRDASAPITVVALSDSPTTLSHAMKSAAQVGLTALCILQLAFKQKFELLGIRADIEALKRTAAL